MLSIYNHQKPEILDVLSFAWRTYKNTLKIRTFSPFAGLFVYLSYTDLMSVRVSVLIQ